MPQAHRLLFTIKDAIKKKGLGYVIKKGIYVWLFMVYFKLLGGKKSFSFQGNNYNYFHDVINNTWSNERSIEIPIMMEIVNKNKDKKILEVGNVLSNYFSIPHDVVDKYEVDEGVINQDIVDYNPAEKYDLIVSISTLEHVGWDETPRDDTKIPRAMENLRRLSKPGGLIAITLPIGYNSVLDKLLKEGKVSFPKQYYLKRISKANEWKEASWQEVENVKFGVPYTGANGLVVGFIHT